MNPNKKWLKIAGLVLNVLIAGLLIFAGSGKVFGFAPPELAEKMAGYGLGDKLKLIGCGEMISALLLLIPRTSPLGTLLVSGFSKVALSTTGTFDSRLATPALIV